MTYSFLSRTRVISFFLVALALILIVKLFFVQVLYNNSYSNLADRQYATPSSNLFERRTILFERKDGQDVSAAVQTTGFKVAINPEIIADAENIYNKLSGVVAIDHNSFIAKASKKGDSYEE